jgi:hypothetical protein
MARTEHLLFYNTVAAAATCGRSVVHVLACHPCWPAYQCFTSMSRPSFTAHTVHAVVTMGVAMPACIYIPNDECFSYT